MVFDFFLQGWQAPFLLRTLARHGNSGNISGYLYMCPNKVVPLLVCDIAVCRGLNPVLYMDMIVST
jgi:hypothetical protein